jgi:hypothetical protein
MSNDLTAIAPSSSEKSPDAAALSATGLDRNIPVEESPTTPRNGQALVKRRPARVKPPKDSKVYKIVLAVVALRAQGVKAKEISETLNYSEDTIRQYVSRAYKKGWINISSFSDVDDQLEYVLKHQVVENVHTVLGERTDEGFVTSGAREMTIEAAKGLGLFKAHQVVKGDVTNVGVALRVQVEMPANSPVVIRPGTVGGMQSSDVPIDAEIVKQEE